MKQYRHGDVLVVRIDEIPQDVKKLDHLVLAWGEVTGHKHQLDVGELFETKNGKLYFRLNKKGRLSHEEHKTIELPAGNYEVIGQREYYPAEIRRVRD